MNQGQKNLNEEDPPDSLLAERKILVKESAEKGGSFLVERGVKVITDINQCLDLWEKFSLKKTLFDTWEFRYAFYKGYNYKPYFILLSQE